MKKDEYRKNIQEAFLNTLKEMKETGIGSLWECPWFKGAVPQNGKTKRPYNGINKAFLRFTQSKLNSEDPRWYTFNQIKDVKGTVHQGQKWKLKKGSKGTQVEYWYPYDLKEKKKITWEEYRKKEGKDCTLFAFYQTVFNGSQIEGIEPFVEERPGTTERSDKIAVISKNMGVPIYEDTDEESFYIPAKDEIHLPRTGLFKTASAYNATALHELCHATGHESRLNRKIKNWFGNKDYAFEELVAEIGSCYCQEYINEEIDSSCLNNSEEYIASWISGLEEKPEALFKAFREAEKAAEFIGAQLKEE